MASTHVRIDNELYEKAAELAKAEERTITNMINVLLVRALKNAEPAEA